MYQYVHLDVFTNTPFEGNQLAVFPGPAGLTASQMQLIAREMAFSESTFIFPPERGGDVRMRIFTPGEELPMAGHPTIGSTFAPGFGIGEDPATGAASGPLGCYLLHHKVVSAEKAREMLSLQGVAMARPSRIHISIDRRDQEIARVRVGGQAIVVGRGQLEI